MRNNRTISTLSLREKSIVARVIAGITEQVKPLMVFYVNSSLHKIQDRSIFPRADIIENYVFKVRLLIVLQDKQDRIEFNFEDKALKDNVKYELITTDVETMKYKLSSYNLFYCWLYKSGVLLYEKENAFNVLPSITFSKKRYANQIADWYSTYPDLHNGLDISLNPKPCNEEVAKNTSYRSPFVIHNSGNLTIKMDN